MTLALILAADHRDDFGAPALHADTSTATDAREHAARVAARDRVWAEQLQSADDREAQEAFAALLHEYTNRLVRFAFGFVRSTDTAEDVVQDVCARLWEKRRALQHGDAIRAYLFTAVRRAALNWLKHEAIEARYAASVTPGLSFAHTLTIEDQLDTDAVTNAIRHAMEHLSERRQTALRLRYEEQLPFAVVAQVLGITEKAAKNLVARAVEELRGYFGL